MRQAWLALGFLMVVSGAGCLNPATTKLPTCRVQPLWAERQSLSHYDPLPDPNLGPETHTRPLWFQEGRTQTRQALEGRVVPTAPAGPSPPGFSNGAYRNSNVVR